MKKQISRLSAVGCLALIGQLFIAQTVLAHHAELSGEFVCSADGLYLQYTATAWEGDGNVNSRENPQVEVYVNDVLVQTGAFAAPDYSFSGAVPVPESAAIGDMIAVMVLTVGSWGNGTGGGESTSEFFFVPDLECETPATGRFTGGGNSIRMSDSVRLTRGLTLHCDLLLSNNLQVNWPGNKFHTLEHLLTVACTDDPAIIQAPPDSPVDTIIGVGNGRWNGTKGYTIEFTLRDFGEPGKKNDEVGLLIYETGNSANVVLDLPLQKIRGGNIQTHYDQPHR